MRIRSDYKNGHTLAVHITTLGCAKNQYDSDILLGQLKANGVKLQEDPEEADVLMINTCGFITPAKKESIETILQAVNHKNGKQVLVLGCLSSRYKNDLQINIPEVDAYFGTEDYDRILRYLGLSPKNPEHLYENRFISTKSHYAYLKISEGCNHKCAFCAIPLMRGRHRSRPLEEVEREAQILAAKGVKELLLVAQDTTFYGVDLYGKQKLAELLRALENINGIEWIRLHYAYPTTFREELLDLMERSQKIVPYIDMPIQHISDKMLKIMKRGGTSWRIKKILTTIRKRLPQAAIRTTLLLGHPGETHEEYLELKNFITDFKFDRLGTFVYSPEENTAAHQLSHPSPETALERQREIMQIQQKISLKKNRDLIGKKLEVVIDEVDSDNKIAIGRTFADSPDIDNETIIENISENIYEGHFHEVKIVNASEYELYAISGESL